MTDTVEIDLTYAISEIQDIQSELELHSLSDMGARLEGVEARLKEIGDTLLEYFSAYVTSGPHSAAATAYERLAAPLPQR